MQVAKVNYAKSRSKLAKDFRTASKDQQIFIRFGKAVFWCLKTSDWYSFELVKLKFQVISPIENQFNLPLIINLNSVLIKFKTLRSTGNVKRGVADLIVNAHYSPLAFSALLRRNNNRVFVLEKILFFVYASQILTLTLSCIAHFNCPLTILFQLSYDFFLLFCRYLKSFDLSYLGMFLNPGLEI